MKLIIISHTPHYMTSSGSVVGWGATIRELNYLTEIFDQVVHVAPLHNQTPPTSSMPYTSDKVQFIPLKPSGGTTLKDKIGIVLSARHNIKIIRKALKQGDIFQFRSPTGMGVYVIPYLLLCAGKRGWFKYAGNWVQKNPPWSYAIQKMMLVAQKHHLVTINGSWPNQPQHVVTFENPCLTQEERHEGLRSIDKKKFSGRLDFVFIGRLEEAKGVSKILSMAHRLKDHPRMGTLYLVGDGPKANEYREMINEFDIKVKMLGFLNKDEICDILDKVHAILLPSNSEGFPKVIAEGANFGCIPIVSDISCLSQYIHTQENGYVMESLDTQGLVSSVSLLLDQDEVACKNLAMCAYNMAAKFTYAYYNQRLMEQVVHE